MGKDERNRGGDVLKCVRSGQQRTVSNRVKANILSRETD